VEQTTTLPFYFAKNQTLLSVIITHSKSLILEKSKKIPLATFREQSKEGLRFG
jgi:hypothetical protein